MEVNFCPFCDASRHKLVHLDSMLLCKECNRFFKLEEVRLRCMKCRSTKVGSSDFPSPSGELVLQCSSCKKMFGAKEFLNFNKIQMQG